MYWFVRFAFWVYFYTFHRFRVYGKEHTKGVGGIIAANHASFYDPPLIAAGSVGEIHFLARKSLFKLLFGKLLLLLNAHPLAAGVSSLGVIKQTCGLLKEGKKVVIFPEGERTHDGELGKMKPGVALLVAKSKCDIIPTYVHGSYDVWCRKKKVPLMHGKLAVVFGAPLPFSMYEGLEKKEFQKKVLQDIEKSIRALKIWYESGAQGSSS